MLLLKQYIATIKQANVKSDEIKEYVEVIKTSNLGQILEDAKKIIWDKELGQDVNARVYKIAKTIIILNHIDRNRYIYPYSEKELDKLGYTIYKRFHD